MSQRRLPPGGPTAEPSTDDTKAKPPRGEGGFTAEGIARALFGRFYWNEHMQRQVRQQQGNTARRLHEERAEWVRRQHARVKDSGLASRRQAVLKRKAKHEADTTPAKTTLPDNSDG
jgi:hypothetical protein